VREGAEEAGERTVREGAEETGERTVREGAEETGERTVREGAEETGERTAREGAEETGERSAREGAEEAGERGARTEATARQANEIADDFRRKADEVLETAPPLQQRVNQVTGVDKGPSYTEAQDELRDWYRKMEADARPVQVSGTRTDGPYGWNYGYEVTEFPHGVTHVKIKVHLQPGAGVTPADLARVQADARVGVDQYYNFQHTVTNSSGNPSRLHVEVEYVTDPTQAHLRVDVHGGEGHANLSNWYVESSPTVHAHELGHQMGLVDEYVDPSVANRATPTSPGVAHDQGLMTNFWADDGAGGMMPHPNTHLPQRNLDEIGDDIRRQAGASSSPPTSSTAPPAPNVGDDIAATAPNAPRSSHTAAEQARRDRLNEIDREYRTLIDNPPPGRTADDMRYERHRARSEADGRAPLDRAEWEESRDLMRGNAERGLREQDAVIDDLGLRNNNRGTPTEYRVQAGDQMPDGRPVPSELVGVTTRPDSITPHEWVEVKSMAGGTPDNPQVLYDSPQLRAQRVGAAADNGKVSNVILVTPDPTTVRPSRELASRLEESGGAVYCRGADGYHRWNVDDLAPGGGTWERV
jgi:hypothetical protein